MRRRRLTAVRGSDSTEAICGGVPADSRALQYHGRLVQARAVGVERVRRELGVAIGVGPAAVLDRLAHAGQRLGAVAGKAAGSVDEILVPAPATPAHFVRQRLVDVGYQR